MSLKTIVYHHETRPRSGKSKNGWWWANAENHHDKHGPFDTKAEAEDAANAARITAKDKARREKTITIESDISAETTRLLFGGDKK